MPSSAEILLVPFLSLKICVPEMNNGTMPVSFRNSFTALKLTEQKKPVLKTSRSYLTRPLNKVKSELGATWNVLRTVFKNFRHLQSNQIKHPAQSWASAIKGCLPKKYPASGQLCTLACQLNVVLLIGGHWSALCLSTTYDDAVENKKKGRRIFFERN